MNNLTIVETAYKNDEGSIKIIAYLEISLQPISLAH